MNIGFVNIFSFRPHVEHLHYLQALFKDAGYNTFALTCDSSVSSCYPQLLKKSKKYKECSKCILGGIRSYPMNNITSLSHKETPSLSDDILEELSFSSSCTISRSETEKEWNADSVAKIRDKLKSPILHTYNSTKKWIDDNHLDLVVCFNGRMDLTRAITYACEKSNVKFVTHERTWFGDGLHLIPNANCLSIKHIRNMILEFDDKPLTKNQAQFAARLIALRFLQKNTLEWRLYNKDAKLTQWPIKSNRNRVLILPSSKNEFVGHQEWSTGWKDNTLALDDFFDAFSIDINNVVIRFHPNWSEFIGKNSGEGIIKHYKKWANDRGILFIASDDKSNTYDLIKDADMVVLNGGSSAIEAGACGKQIICLSPSTYDGAGFVRVFNNKNELYRNNALIDIDKKIVMQKTLRYVYLHAKRFAQYVNFVKAIETTKYRYFHGADVNKIIKMANLNIIEADDNTFAVDDTEENKIIEILEKMDWKSLVEFNVESNFNKELKIQRRFGLRWIDKIRDKLPRGDL